ncbi:uncharacterized protein LOC142324739 [Lycorma delicatula]|uniref:uncharacterized protein LOC142324739 n=1 Tax=Lycorma delicatula TaxID=130591 RepID=UPI003F512D31
MKTYWNLKLAGKLIDEGMYFQQTLMRDIFLKTKRCISCQLFLAIFLSENQGKITACEFIDGIQGQHEFYLASGTEKHEMNRLLRSDYYNLMNEKIFSGMQFTGEEGESNKHVLYGNIKKESKLLVKSPLFHEVSNKDHPTELLKLGLSSEPPIRNEKLLKLYDSYTLPEEYLEENELSVGILGHSRGSYEPLLQPKETLLETVKRYTIKSGLPGIFLGKITSPVEKSSLDALSYLSNVSPSKEEEKEPSPVMSSIGESEDEAVQVIVRSKEFYKDLHQKRRLHSLKMWKKHKSLSSHLKFNRNKKFL